MSPIKDWLGNVTADGDMVSVTVGLPDDPVPIEQDYEMVPVDRITTHPDNARRGNMEVIRESIRANGFYGVCVVQRSTARILVGNHRYRAAIEEGLTEVPIVWVDKSDEEARRLLLVDNRSTDLAVYDDEALVALLTAHADDGGWTGTGWDDGDLTVLLDSVAPPLTPPKSLADSFGVPPFSILDSRQGYWQDRKRAWKALGIESEVGRDGALSSQGWATMMDSDYRPGMDSSEGRDENLTFGSGNDDPVSQKLHGVSGGTSIFDPVLTEMLVRWFCPPDGHILDPFAGGVVRAVVSACLGRTYVGIDISARQIAANEAQAHLWKGKKYPTPIWINDDARNVASTVAGRQFDFVMTCPPYADLEQYDPDNPADLSNLHPEEFIATFAEIIASTVPLMADGSFMALVVSEVRNSKRPGGPYLGVVPGTIQAMCDAGLHYYNELVLINAVATLPLRAGRQMVATRKVGRGHQNVLIAYKGNLADIPPLDAQAIGDLDAAVAQNDWSE